MFFNRAAKHLAKEDPQQFESQKKHILRLLKRPDTEAVDILFSVVKNYENPILVKIALTVLSEMNNQEAIAVLTNCMFEHRERLHRGDAARALGYSRNAKAIVPLKRLLEKSEAEADDLPISEGLFAVMSLCHLGVVQADGEWLSMLRRWETSQDPEHRVMARAIMHSLHLVGAST